jgi:hypothetical protein
MSNTCGKGVTDHMYLSDSLEGDIYILGWSPLNKCLYSVSAFTAYLLCLQLLSTSCQKSRSGFDPAPSIMFFGSSRPCVAEAARHHERRRPDKLNILRDLGITRQARWPFQSPILNHRHIHEVMCSGLWRSSQGSWQKHPSCSRE